LEQLFRHRIEKAFEKVGKYKATFHKQEGGFVIFAALFLTRSFRYACRAEIEDGYTRIDKSDTVSNPQGG
jgi:hypothetical protein